MYRLLARNTGAYALANALVAVAPFALLPVYTRALPPEQFGIVSMYLTLVALAVPLVGGAVSGAVQRRYFDLEGARLAQYVGACLLIIAGGTTVLALVGFAVSDFISNMSGFPNIWLAAVPLAAAGLACQQVLLALWQAQSRIGVFLAFQLAVLALSIALPIFLVLVLRMQWRGAVIGSSVTNTLAGLAAFAVMARTAARAPPVLADVRNALTFSLPLVPHLLAGWAIAMFDRLLISHYLGLAAVGVYSLAFQASQAISLLSASVNQAYTPWFFAALKTGTWDRKVAAVRFTYAYAAALAGAGLLLACVVTFAVRHFLDAKYHEAILISYLLITGFVVNGFYRIISTSLLYAERTWLIAVGTLGCAIFSAGANWFLLPRFGLVAAGWTCVISFTLLFAWTLHRAVRIVPMPWRAAW